MKGIIKRNKYEEARSHQFCIGYLIEEDNFIFLGYGNTEAEAKRDLVNNVKKICTIALADLDEITKLTEHSAEITQS